MKFSRILAKYYEKWYRDCYDSSVYCLERNMLADATEYMQKMQLYFDLINEHWYEIDFFKKGDIAFYYPEIQDKEFQKYLEAA